MELDTTERLEVLERIVATLARAVGMERDVYLQIVEQAAQSVWDDRDSEGGSSDSTTH